MAPPSPLPNTCQSASMQTPRSLWRSMWAVHSQSQSGLLAFVLQTRGCMSCIACRQRVGCIRTLDVGGTGLGGCQFWKPQNALCLVARCYKRERNARHCTERGIHMDVLNLTTHPVAGDMHVHDACDADGRTAGPSPYTMQSCI
jgi:hypothetical protein